MRVADALGVNNENTQPLLNVRHVRAASLEPTIAAPTLTLAPDQPLVAHLKQDSLVPWTLDSMA